MPVGQTITEVDRIERFFRGRSWTTTTGVSRGEIYYTSPKPNDEWQVQVSVEGYWALCHFTDGDLPNDAFKGGMEAVGRYESVEEGDTVEELEKAMVSVEAMPWECPHCGEAGGEPITTTSREWQGHEAPIGGWVEFTEEMCTKCLEAARIHNMKMAMEGF